MSIRRYHVHNNCNVARVYNDLAVRNGLTVTGSMNADGGIAVGGLAGNAGGEIMTYLTATDVRPICQ